MEESHAKLRDRPCLEDRLSAARGLYLQGSACCSEARVLFKCFPFGECGNPATLVVWRFQYKNTLLRTCQVSVISIDEDAVKERQWINEIEQNAWTNDMSVMEKLKAIEQYIYDNYTYTTDGIMCNAGAEALLFAARDLGLTARYRFVGPQYDYEKGFGDVYYHFGSAFCGGHVCTIITIDGKEYIMETQGHEG